eukprot:CAMPEP_0203906104 /NCGR_PEP_ID=MMETSP0359-20131031/47779_1 /ASSEMBLY_ACC=CAM_ASM_000338 /TAXON_ID=268821 /ORGANISM="Scrippsiella Hangoei, Strain SHTV-5" /LENGTH=57 /DNA_ID=CAMNT_0050830691 /DNA_START=37 /DNA_END=210 /DNA_ORIENTATION=+
MPQATRVGPRGPQAADTARPTDAQQHFEHAKGPGALGKNGFDLAGASIRGQWSEARL